MSSVKCIGAMAAAGALVSGGYSLYRGSKARKQVISNAETIAKSNHGQIPTGGMTKDGKMWDGYTTVDKVKKDTAKGLALGTLASTVAGAVMTAVVSGLTLLAKAHIK